jgi:hypothetical protein
MMRLGRLKGRVCFISLELPILLNGRCRGRAPPLTAGKPMILVTGGAGFIGANFILDWIAASGEPVVNLDKLTYAGNLENLAALERRYAPHLRSWRYR